VLSGGATAAVGFGFYAIIPTSDRVAFSGLALCLLPALVGSSWMASSLASLWPRWPLLATALATGTLNLLAALPCSLMLAYATESLIWVPYLVAVVGLSMVALVTWVVSFVLHREAELPKGVKSLVDQLSQRGDPSNRSRPDEEDDMSTITAQDTVGQLAARLPSAAKVFHERGIDFCCGGGQTLGDACAAANQPTDLVIEELEKVAGSVDEGEVPWADAPLPELIEFIEHTFHEPLRESLPRLVSWSDAVVRAHGSHTEEPVQRLRDVVHELAGELLPHMVKEERVLFPMIQAGNGQAAGGPIRVMQAEHEDAGRQLASIRSLARDFRIPEGACQTWTALYRELEQLDVDLRQHIHLENNVLFPRALAGSTGG
jgi:regulator of cell morphogenesis and NO signaling